MLLLKLLNSRPWDPRPHGGTARRAGTGDPRHTSTVACAFNNLRRLISGI